MKCILGRAKWGIYRLLSRGARLRRGALLPHAPHVAPDGLRGAVLVRRHLPRLALPHAPRGLGITFSRNWLPSCFPRGFSVSRVFRLILFVGKKVLDSGDCPQTTNLVFVGALQGGNYSRRSFAGVRQDERSTFPP